MTRTRFSFFTDHRIPVSLLPEKGLVGALSPVNHRAIEKGFTPKMCSCFVLSFFNLLYVVWVLFEDFPADALPLSYDVSRPNKIINEANCRLTTLSCCWHSEMVPRPQEVSRTFANGYKNGGKLRKLNGVYFSTQAKRPCICRKIHGVIMVPGNV